MQKKMPRLQTEPAWMKKVDRLGWVAGFSLKSYGVKIGVRTNQPSVLDVVRDLLPKESEAISTPIVDRIYSIMAAGPNGRSARRLNFLYGDDERLARSLNIEEVYEKFESNLRLFVAEFAKHRVFVHAGVVGWKG